MEGIKINKKPRLRNPNLVVAWPGMGEVAFKAASYLVEQLKAEEFAFIEPESFFYLTGGIIEKGVLSIPELPYGKFYYWKNPVRKNDLIIFISNAQPDLAKAEAYSQRIIQLSRIFKVKNVIGFAAMPQAIDHMHAPRVWYASTSEELNKTLKNYRLNFLSEGQISGMNGLFLGLAKKEGLNGYCLLGEIPLYTIQIENPKAAYAVLEALSRILDIPINFTHLIEQTRAMEEEINKLLDYLKIDIAALGPIGEEEIEKIKKTLSQLTKLPGSVKEKIEKLFGQARADISKANELKSELDRWNVYKEYEDRFLDLFKKKENKSN
ncbi:MAG: PAC2 family protein [Candidatus Omnitrophica bacterium]|nr:PAC2 family protein [Candidatus Omnitrophota bacterium]